MCVGEDITPVMESRMEAPLCSPTTVTAFEYDENYVAQEVSCLYMKQQPSDCDTF